ncbi:SGNH/GDSL hydrolase family protein [Geodermatophilus sp. SYSU D01045]
MPRRTSLALALLLAATVPACGSPDGGSAPRATVLPGTAEQGAGPTPAPSPTPSPTPSSTPSSPVTVFLGDSYTVGEGGQGYVEETAALLGWTAVPLGESGTGYVDASTRPGQAPFGRRVPAVAAASPDVVVVQGSTNDADESLAAVGEAARALYVDLARTVPGARVVVLGPLSPPELSADAVAHLRDVLAEAAADAGLPFVDPVAGGWLVPSDGLFADGLHPNDAGYAQMATRLAEALRAAGL